MRQSLFGIIMRLGASLALAGVVLLSMAGCISAVQGASFQAGEDRLRAIPGVQSAAFTYTELQQTLSSQTVLRVRVEAEPGNGSPTHLAEQVARVAWAVGSKKPEGGISVTIETYPQVNYGLALKKKGWDFVTVGKPNPALFVLSFRDASRTLGEWPGRPPD
ncbi:hypothetical protein [Curtobacterium sp. TXMA1]|uniref:hypothetical protein n=1 Tax=Curtobacterium sp. TXMA1 TaxID=2876939 RepID=UPI001CCB7162|nr:hypothetical protein [Curtobacterium sp. TXMA1]UBQ03634.1 hypothetical protein LCG91_05590 [Curtobacterium sp. TXMA1]